MKRNALVEKLGDSQTTTNSLQVNRKGLKLKQEIIAVNLTEINGIQVNAVNAREIHTYLDVKTQFSTWIQRAIEKYDFIENNDYSILNIDNPNGGRDIIDYFVTIDMSKELCMLENNPKGKETRKYFISKEKQSHKVLSVQEQIALIAQGHHEVDNRITVLEKTKRLENWQERALTDAKNKKVYEIAQGNKELATTLHRKVWSIFKKNFHLPRYNELPAIRYEDGVAYIKNLSLVDLVA